MVPGADLPAALTRVRSLYGAGLGLASLKVLANVVRATVGYRWDAKNNEDGSSMEDLFAEIDADISQALQSSREELESGRVGDKNAVRNSVGALRVAVEESQQWVNSWGGTYPFERAVSGLAYWRLP